MTPFNKPPLLGHYKANNHYHKTTELAELNNVRNANISTPKVVSSISGPSPVVCGSSKTLQAVLRAFPTLISEGLFFSLWSRPKGFI